MGKAIDLNCDMGEGCGNDAELVKYISSANIACGFHAGDATVMRITAELALENGVAIGAHPSFPDRENFGRTRTMMPPREVFDMVVYQVSAMAGICRSLGTTLNHVKPHGALYNQAAADAELATAIAEAVRAVDDRLIFYGLSGSSMIEAAAGAGLRTASEVFADRTYQPDGSLTLRSFPDALVDGPAAAAFQAARMASEGVVTAVDGTEVSVAADTICIHGDGEHAVAFALRINESLRGSGLSIKPIKRSGT